MHATSKSTRQYAIQKPNQHQNIKDNIQNHKETYNTWTRNKMDIHQHPSDGNSGPNWTKMHNRTTQRKRKKRSSK